MQNLSTNPVELIEAPGLGKAIEVISITYKYTFVTSAYNNLSTKIHTDGRTTAWYTTPTIDWGDDYYGYGVPVSATTTPYWDENKAIYYYSTGATGSGSGTIDFYILYRIITL